MEIRQIRVEESGNTAYRRRRFSETYKESEEMLFWLGGALGRGERLNYCGLGKVGPVFCQASQIPGWEQD